jgi:hypothetical protein
LRCGAASAWRKSRSAFGDIGPVSAAALGGRPDVDAWLPAEDVLFGGGSFAGRALRRGMATPEGQLGG